MCKSSPGRFKNCLASTEDRFIDWIPEDRFVRWMEDGVSYFKWMGCELSIRQFTNSQFACHDQRLAIWEFVNWYRGFYAEESKISKFTPPVLPKGG